VKLSTLLLFAPIALSITGCSFSNPFIPPHGSQEVIYESSYPSEPIKSKPMYRATMKPYTVDGVRYTPIIPYIGQTFEGTASWYGPNFHGNKTSNGEYYDMHAATAAHKTLPINTLLQVTNLENGLSTIVRVNDRGPFVKNRIIDLSRQAALDIDMIKKGTAHVRLEVIDFDKTASSYAKSKSLKREVIQPLEKEQLEKSTPSPSSLTYKVQIVSTQNRAKANALVQKYAIIDDKYKASLKTKTFWQKTYYKVLIGDFKSADEAQNFIAEHYFDGAFVVKE
jgi:rare lipoprotein A